MSDEVAGRFPKSSGTAAEWAASNPVLLLGEEAWESDTRRSKIGDGTTAYNALPYTDAPLTRVVEGPLSFLDRRVGGVIDNAMNSPVDNAAALNRAIAMIGTGGGKLFVPRGVYPYRTAPNAIPSGMLLEGEGYDYSTSTTTRPSRGSVFRALASMQYLLRIGIGVGLGTGLTAAQVNRMSLDGNNLATSTLWTNGSRNRVSHTQVYSGASQAVLLAGQNVHLENCIFAQDDSGDVILVTGTNVLDNKIWTSQIRSPGPTGTGVRILGGNATDIQMCHLWAGGGGVATQAESLISVQSTAAQGVFNTLITDNTIEGVWGPEIMLDATLGQVVVATVMTGNKFYMNDGTPDATYPVIYLKGGSISTTVLSGGSVNGVDSTHRYKSLFDLATAVSATGGTVVTGISARHVAALFTGKTPPAAFEFAANQIYDGTSWKRTNNRGVATFTGDGTATSFTIPHGLIATPSEAHAVAGSPAASAPSYTVFDATNVVVTFATAPVNGASIKLNWRADI